MTTRLRFNGHRAVRAYDSLRIGEPAVPARPEAACTRCSCRLSQYRPAVTMLCAPCQASLLLEGEA